MANLQGPFYTVVGLMGMKFPEGFYEDIRDTGNQMYGKENLDVTYRQIEWNQKAPGVWEVKVGPPL